MKTTKLTLGLLALVAAASVALGQTKEGAIVDQERTQAHLGAMQAAAVEACTPKGSAVYGTTINGFLGSSGSCSSFDPVNGTFWADFYSFNATAGHTIRVTAISTLSYLATVQDFGTGTVLANSGTCGYLQSSCAFTYLVPVSGSYFMGIGAYTSGGVYSLTLTEVTPPSATCTPSSINLCLAAGRFRVTATYSSPNGSGTATAVGLTGDTGWFWFFSPGNLEAVVKVLDGRTINGRFWVFTGGLTNVAVTITVRDTQTGAVRQYSNLQGVAFQPVQDTLAFTP